MPAVTEGTVGPATATVSMSLKLAPFMQLMTQRELAGPLIVKYIFSASVAADALIGETGLFIKITLWDGQKVTKSEYTIPITANRSIAPKF